MHDFVLEPIHLCEFGLVNYGLSENQIECYIRETLDYKFKQEIKIIYEGADIFTHLEHEEWNKRCQALLQTFFSRAGQYSGIITFPDTKFTAQGKPWENIINTLKHWCESSNSGSGKNIQEDATGLIIRNYDLKNHLNFCGITDDEMKAILTFKNFEQKSRTPENTQFLVFNPSEKIVLVIRVVGSKHHGQLKGETFHCIDDVNLLSFLLKDELKNSGVIVTGLIVYSGENTHSQTGCIDCDNFIVSCEIFNSVTDFDNFWKKFVKQHKFERLASKLKARKKSNMSSLFQSVASKMVGYLAHLQFKISKISEKPVLPVIEEESGDNIKQAELLLDKYQMEIAYSNEKRILLTGDYGTGKTVVALKKLELLYEGLKEKDVIYYVNFAAKSQLYLEIMEKSKTKEKVKVIKGGTSLSNIIYSKILSVEKKNKTENVNLIVDEYDSQDLSEKESQRLYDILQDEVHFKNSTVLIAIQPIEIDRTDYFTVAGKKRKYSQAKHVFGKLEEIMKVFKLRHVMRVTVELDNLIKLTQSYLNNKTNLYKGQRKNYSEKIEKKAPEKLVSKLQQESSKTSKNTKNKPNYLHQNRSAKSSSPLIAVSGFSLDSSIHSIPIHFQEILDHDELYKLTSTLSKKKKRNPQEVITKYRYTCDSEIGHGINGPLPKLIKLPKSTDLCEEIVLIAFLLLEIIEVKSKRIAIIHFDKTDPIWFQLLFEVTNFFPGVTVTKDIGKFFRNAGNMVLLNNYSCVKGLEFSEVLLILDANEYYLKQFIPEAIARCMSKLVILVRPKPKGNHKSGTVTDLVHHWEKSSYKTRKSILAILKLKFCSEHSSTKNENYRETHCQKDTSKYTSYKIHKRCKWFRDLSAKIQDSIDRNLHSEAKMIQEEAEAR